MGLPEWRFLFAPVAWPVAWLAGRPTSPTEPTGPRTQPGCAFQAQLVGQAQVLGKRGRRLLAAGGHLQARTRRDVSVQLGVPSWSWANNMRCTPPSLLSQDHAWAPRRTYRFCVSRPARTPLSRVTGGGRQDTTCQRSSALRGLGGPAYPERTHQIMAEPR